MKGWQTLGPPRASNLPRPASNPDPDHCTQLPAISLHKCVPHCTSNGIPRGLMSEDNCLARNFPTSLRWPPASGSPTPEQQLHDLAVTNKDTLSPTPKLCSSHSQLLSYPSGLLPDVLPLPMCQCLIKHCLPSICCLPSYPPPRVWLSGSCSSCNHPSLLLNPIWPGLDLQLNCSRCIHCISNQVEESLAPSAVIGRRHAQEALIQRYVIFEPEIHLTHREQRATVSRVIL